MKLRPVYFLAVIFFLFTIFFLTAYGAGWRFQLLRWLSIKTQMPADNVIQNGILLARIQELEKQPQILKKEKGHFLVAHVFLNYPFSQRTEFILDAGERLGVHDGMPVLSNDFLIGIVEKSYQDYSVLKTFWDPSISLKAFALDKAGKQYPVLFIGNQIPTVTFGDKAIEVGDIIINADSRLPFGWKIGTVKQKIENPATAYSENSVELDDTFLEKNSVLIFLGHGQ